MDYNQSNCIGVMLEYIVTEILGKQVKGEISLNEVTRKLYDKIESEGLGSISPYTRHSGNLVLPRKYELCAAINRFRELKIK